MPLMLAVFLHIRGSMTYLLHAAMASHVSGRDHSPPKHCYDRFEHLGYTHITIIRHEHLKP